MYGPACIFWANLTPLSLQSREFAVSTPAGNGGTGCAFDSGAIETRACDAGPCVKNCVGSWTAW